MLNKIKKASNYLIYVLFSNVLFGAIYYFVFTRLAKYSLLYAYMGSLALIFIGLWIDSIMKKYFISEKLMNELQALDDKSRETNYKMLQWIINNFVSFKTVLFVFYFFILVFSQIINIDPSQVNESIRNFILANSYGIVLLIAFDRIIGQFAKDRKEMGEISESLEKSWDKINDEA